MFSGSAESGSICGWIAGGNEEKDDFCVEIQDKTAKANFSALDNLSLNEFQLSLLRLEKQSFTLQIAAGNIVNDESRESRESKDF
jgi:hypothetical protein